jgi:hypothetical protein
MRNVNALSFPIIVAGFGLLLWWFHYICVSILERRADDRRSVDLAARIRLNFPDVQRSLASALPNGRHSILRLQQLLQEDHTILVDLLLPCALEVASLDRYLLSLHYRVMRLHFLVTWGIAPSEARKSLAEMARVLNYFAADVVGPEQYDSVVSPHVRWVDPRLGFAPGLRSSSDSRLGACR